MENYDLELQHYEVTFHDKESDLKSENCFYVFLSSHRLTSDFVPYSTSDRKALMINSLSELLLTLPQILKVYWSLLSDTTVDHMKIAMLCGKNAF